MTEFSLRHYQSKLINDWGRIMELAPEQGRKFKHAFLQAPTGSGKTEVVFGIADTFLKGQKSIFATPRYALNDQNEERALSRLGEEHGVLFMTVQKLASIARMKKAHKDYRLVYGASHVFFDEVHLYSTGEELRQIKLIMKELKIPSATYVSATAWDVNERVLGSRTGRTAIYKFGEAYKDGVLNPVEIVRYDTGTSLTMKETLQNENVIELLDMSPEAQARELKRLDIGVRDLEEVIEHRIRSLIKLYMGDNAGRQSLFFVPNLKFVQYAKTVFSAYERKNVRVDFITHEDANAVKKMKIENFLSSKTTVMIACGMLREGFDFPELELVYDCAFNPQNIRLALQKIGRLTRKSASKNVSRFYYAVDSRLILSTDNKIYMRDRNGIPARADAIMLAAYADGDLGQKMVVDPTVTTSQHVLSNVSGEVEHVTLSHARIWEVESVEGVEKKNTVQLDELVSEHPNVISLRERLNGVENFYMLRDLESA